MPSSMGLNPHLLRLLHWQAGSLPLAPPGEPRMWPHICFLVYLRSSISSPCVTFRNVDKMIATLEHRLVARHFPYVYILDSKYPNNFAEGGFWCSKGESQDSSGGFPTADRLLLSGAVILLIHRGSSLSPPHLISTLPQICGSWKQIWALFTWCNLENAPLKEERRCLTNHWPSFAFFKRLI